MIKKRLPEIIVAVIVIILLSTIFLTKKDKSEESSNSENTTELVTIENNVDMTSNGDSSYNYIMNADKVAVKYKDELPYTYFMNLGDRTNDYLKENGIKGKELTITSVSRKAYCFIAKMSIEDRDEVLTVSYDLIEDQLDFSLQ